MSIINNGWAIKLGVGTIERSIEMHFANEPNWADRTRGGAGGGAGGARGTTTNVIKHEMHTRRCHLWAH